MKYGILITVLAVSLLVAGCVEQPKDTQQGVEEIRVGVVAPLTGGASTTGTDMWQAAVLAADELNAQGGVLVNGTYLKVKLFKGDTETSREGGVKAVTKLITNADMENMFGMAHGGAIFSLLDEAFEMAANSHGTVAVALSMNITYIKPPSTGEVLYAEAREVSRSGRIGTYAINVKNEGDNVIAICHALAYRKRDKLPFLD